MIEGNALEIESLCSSQQHIATEADDISAAAKGDSAAFERIMRRYNQLLFRTARSILQNDAEAEEVVQEGYLNAWRALGKFRSHSKLSTWLVRIVTNQSLGRLRRKRTQTIPLEAAMTSFEPHIQAALTAGAERNPDSMLLRKQVRQVIEKRVDDLPDNFRTVFMLRAVEEMSMREIALALDISEATVRTRFFRARRLLKKWLVNDVDAAIGEAFSFAGARCDRIVDLTLARASDTGLISDLQDRK